MQFELKSYCNVTLIWTLIFLAFCTVDTMIYVIIFFKKHSLGVNKQTAIFLLNIAVSCFIIHFLSAPLVHGIHLINEKENDKVEACGIITEIKDTHGIDKYMYDGHVTYASHVYINDERYYIMYIGDYEVGDEVTFEYLPKSKIIMSINDA